MLDNKPLIVAISVAVLALLGITGYFVLFGENSAPKKNQQEVSIPLPIPDPNRNWSQRQSLRLFRQWRRFRQTMNC